MKDVETRVGLGDGRFESCTVTIGKVMGDGGISFMVISTDVGGFGHFSVRWGNNGWRWSPFRNTVLTILLI